MTQLYFRYNPYYDQTLARLAGEKLDVRGIQEGYEFIDRITAAWSPLNDRLFRYYRSLDLVLPNFWFAYPVHAQSGLIPFDDPMTIIIKSSLDEVVATVIHELCNAFFGYIENRKACDRLWTPVEEAYRSEDRDTQIHLIVNILARAGLYEVFGEEKAESLLKLEKHFSGLEQAWAIIDKLQLDPTQPLKAILCLAKQD